MFKKKGQMEGYVPSNENKSIGEIMLDFINLMLEASYKVSKKMEGKAA